MLPSSEGEPAEKKPWSTPTVEEVPWDTLPTEMRMLVLGLPDPELGCYGRTARAPLDAAYQAATETQPDAVADVPHQVEAQPPASDPQPNSVNGVNGAEHSEPTATVPSDDPIGSRACAVCEKSAPTRAVSAPDPVPAEQVEIAPQANEMEAALPAEDQSVRHRDQVMRAIEALCPDHTPDARWQEAVGDAGRYLARWGAQAQGCGWTSTQQAALIWQIRGREVTTLSPNQAVIGNKVIYRFQL